MRLTPLEIRKQTFSRRRLGGVDSEEVQDFLNLVAAEFEEILRDNALVSERLTQADQKIHEFRSMEETLRRTLVRAEQLKNESKDNARRECELVLQEARLRAERVLEDARSRLRQLTDEIEELQKKKQAANQAGFRGLAGQDRGLHSIPFLKVTGSDQSGKLRQVAHTTSC